MQLRQYDPSRAEHEDDEPNSPERPRPTWRRKLQTALRGLKLGLRGQSSFFVHFFCAALVLATALALGCSLLEWAILLGCIGLVLVAELLNTALEHLLHGLDPATRARSGPCLDIAAGTVLLATVTAVLVGLLVFGHRLSEVFTPAG